MNQSLRSNDKKGKKMNESRNTAGRTVASIPGVDSLVRCCWLSFGVEGGVSGSAVSRG